MLDLSNLRVSKHCKAHTPNASRPGIWHALDEHLVNAATLAESFCQPLGCSELGRLAGLWHDAGKLHREFQDYLQRCHAAELSGERKPRSPINHSPVGALAWQKLFPPLALLIACHHTGLCQNSELHDSKIPGWRCDPRYVKGLTLAREALGEPTLSATADAAFSAAMQDRQFGALRVELLTRLLFSALIDADRLDTEAHANPDRAEVRGAAALDRRMLDSFGAHMASLADKAGGGTLSPVNDARAEVLNHCLAAGELPPGLFRLTVPTGGGKTLASLGFALKHALHHNLRRIVMAIPYTSIIDQTAEVYRGVFAGLASAAGQRFVLEHHSAVGENTAPGPGSRPAPDESEEQVWRELACENWDAPLIVTTTVQLFDSLHAAGTRACRKLHNLARSVIILDEVQTLPVSMHEPCVRMLEGLVEVAGATIVLCTATQPALEHHSWAFSGFTAEPRDIVPDPERYFELLRRVRWELHLDEPWSWERVVDELLESPQALCVLNTKKDALAVLSALEQRAAVECGDELDRTGIDSWLAERGVFHLSTALCGAHRKEVLAEVRRRLHTHEPCRLVSTQVVEAGVDVDFPLVLRALGPLDRIIQAAGRCNREGKHGIGAEADGRMVVFDPLEGTYPPGEYRTACQHTRALLSDGSPDLDSLDLQRRYFRGTLDAVQQNKPLLDARKCLDYPTTAELGKLIRKETTPVIVRYPQPTVDELLERLRAQFPQFGRLSREDYRALQPHTVSLVRNQLLNQSQFWAETGVADLLLWTGRYDERRGIVPEGDPDDFVVG